MKTYEEMVERVREKKDDMMDFTAEVIVPYLPFKYAKEFLKPEVKESDWEPDILTREVVLSEMREYMVFAWDKATGHRGLSASRSVSKVSTWAWLLGDDELHNFAEDNENYAQYGVPILKKFCEHYEFKMPDGEDIGRMAKGEPCHAECEGCG